MIVGAQVPVKALLRTRAWRMGPTRQRTTHELSAEGPLPRSGLLEPKTESDTPRSTPIIPWRGQSRYAVDGKQ